MGPPGPPATPGLRARLTRAARLGLRYRADAVTACLLLPPVAARLRWRGYRQTTDWLAHRRRPRHRPPPPGDPVETAHDLAFVVRVASRLAPDATCLRQAVVLHHLLGRRGIPAEVRLGVRNVPSGPRNLAFHAWVEVGDRVVSEPESAIADYTVLNHGDQLPGR